MEKQREGRIRSSIYGFNRKDVQGYIEILFRRIHELEEENRKLQGVTAAPEAQTSQTVPEPAAAPVAQAVPEPVVHPAVEAVPETPDVKAHGAATSSVKPKKVVRVKRAGQ